MPRGRLVEGRSVSQYEPPEAPRGLDSGNPELRAEEAIRAGHAQGLARGRAEAAAELEAERARCRAQLAQSLEAVAALEAELLEACKGQLLELASEIASRIVRERVAAGDPVVARIANELFVTAPQSGARTIRVSHEDHHALLDIAPRLGETGAIVIVPDPSIPAGGLIVEAEQEVVDARLETALDAVRCALDDQR